MINTLLAADKELSDRLVQLVVDSRKVLHNRMLASEAESLLADAGREGSLLSRRPSVKTKYIIWRSKAAKITKLKRCES